MFRISTTALLAQEWSQRSGKQFTDYKLKFFVAWQIVTQRENNKQLIAMMHAKNLYQMPQVKKGDASSLRQLINHVSSHMNAL